MNEVILPPSPNWYAATIFSSAHDGTIAWGARNVVVVSKLENDNGNRTHQIIKQAYKDKVTSVAFNPATTGSKMLATTGDDAIKVYNTDTLLATHVLHPFPDKYVVTADWCPFEPQVLYALVAGGRLLMWNLRLDSVSVFSLGKFELTCLSCCPHQKNLIAVGEKSGLLYIVNFGSQSTVLYKLRGHDTEVVSLSWCPSAENVISKNGQRDMLLASGGRDRDIFIWRAGGDGRYETIVALSPTPLDTSKHRSKLNAATGNWIAINWVEPNLLLSSTVWGELVSWDFSRLTKGKPFCRLIHSKHGRGLFCISTSPNKLENETINESSESEKSHTIWTVAQDRKIIGCSASDDHLEIQFSTPTLCGYVYCMASCPFDTSRLAFGVGDAMIRVWNLSEPHTNSINIESFWQKIKGKVRRLAWHPEKENWLAFASEEGRVGLFDVNTNISKPPILYRQYHRSTVYALSWGPCVGHTQPVLYSCGEGELVYYDPQDPNKPPTKVLSQDCGEFSWKPDNSILAVGHTDGSITFLNPEFDPCGSTQSTATNKMVHCLVWHPESTAADLEFSPLRHCLAVSYNSTTIRVYDLSAFVEHLNKPSEEHTDAISSTKSSLFNVHQIYATLKGHSSKVVCLAWSPHLTGRLVSGSYDNTAQVWNVETKELLGTYTGHSGPVFCASWSPLHPDYIITGSCDFTLRIWNAKNLTPILPTEEKKPPAKKNKKKQAKQATQVETNGSPTVELKDVNMVTTALANVTIDKNASPAVKKAPKPSVERISYFPSTSKEMGDPKIALSCLLKLAKETRHSNDAEASEIIDPQTPECVDLKREEYPLFADQKTLLTYLKNESDKHRREEKYTTATDISIWCGSLQDELEKAAEEKRLTDYLVSLAPSVSTKLWKEMCERYASQLRSTGNPRKAATYLLLIHETYGAIDLLLNAGLYNEAYALARCKLDPDDSMINKVLEMYADHLVLTGRYEMGAFIQGKMNKFEDAIRYLGRRRNAEVLATAAEIAVARDDSDSASSLANQSINRALMNSEYKLAREVIARFPQFKHREILLQCHEELMKLIERKVDRRAIDAWITGGSEYSLLNILKSRIGTPDPDCYAALEQNRFDDLEDNEETLWAAVSREIAMASICEDFEKTQKHIVGGLGLIAQYEIVHKKDFEERHNQSPLISLIVHLDLLSRISNESIEGNKKLPVSSSLRAYLGHALIRWVAENQNNEEKMAEEEVEEEVSSPIAGKVIDLILKHELLEDLLGPIVMAHFKALGDIPKLESQVASALAKMATAKTAEQEDITLLKEELESLKNRKKEVIDMYISIPNPVLTYLTAKKIDISLPSARTLIDRVQELWENSVPSRSVATNDNGNESGD